MFIVQFSQDFLSHIYIILEISEFCNKVLTILKNVAIVLSEERNCSDDKQTKTERGAYN